jgi:hypothetical protein
VIFVGSQISSGILVRASISSVPLGFLPFATPEFIPAFWFSEAGGQVQCFFPMVLRQRKHRAAWFCAIISNRVYLSILAQCRWHDSFVQ